tara:strand:+ start:215 stop:586 length:372 start_codon:yes stop_codon:yes gene_type:complete
MGMDVYGNEPKNEKGEYFRANVWSWRPIVCIMDLAGGEELFNEKSWYSMNFNDGAGLDTAELAEELGDRISEWITEKDLTEGHWYEWHPWDDGDDFDRTYGISRDHLKEFVTFLRNCGGFRVW